MKTTDGPDDPWAGVADPVPGTRSEPPTRDVPDRDADPHADDEPDDGPPADDHQRQDPAERLAEEARRLAEAVAGQLGEVRHRVVEPLLRKHPDVAAHLGAAGYELMAAYRALVADKERRWASRTAPAERVDLDADHHDRGEDDDHAPTRDDEPPRG